MTVSSVKNLNGETFSAVQDASLTDIVSSNSANWNEISAYQANSANYLQNTDLTIVNDKITEISGVPLSAGDELPEVVSAAADYVSANSATINGTIDTVSSNSASWGGEALPLSSRDGIDLEISGDMLYIGASALSAAISAKQDELTFDYNASNAISAINGSALAGGGGGGGDVPEGVMAESGLEFNAVNEISGYNGSAIAQYGAEKQWLVHDDTIVHVSNSAQYAFGCNISALQRLMGVDETVLFETTSTSGTPMTDTFNLSGSMADFDRIKILYRPWNDSIIPEWFEFDYNNAGGTKLMRRSTTFTINPLRFIVCEFNFSADNSFVVNDVRFADSSFTTTTLQKDRGTIYKVIGIGRKEV